MSQSLDGGTTWTQSNVSGHPIYFGDICTTGIFCGLAPDSFNWGNDRILFANSDLSGISIFEEAQYHGVEAAQKVLKKLHG